MIFTITYSTDLVMQKAVGMASTELDSHWLAYLNRRPLTDFVKLYCARHI